MLWAIVTNYIVEFLGLRWSAPPARFYRPPTLLAARTTRKSNELELKYTLSVYVQPGHCLISCPLAGLARAATPRYDWEIDWRWTRDQMIHGLASSKMSR